MKRAANVRTERMIKIIDWVATAEPNSIPFALLLFPNNFITSIDSFIFVCDCLWSTSFRATWFLILSLANSSYTLHLFLSALSFSRHVIAFHSPFFIFFAFLIPGLYFWSRRIWYTFLCAFSKHAGVFLGFFYFSVIRIFNFSSPFRKTNIKWKTRQWKKVNVKLCARGTQCDNRQNSKKTTAARKKYLKIKKGKHRGKK